MINKFSVNLKPEPHTGGKRDRCVGGRRGGGVPRGGFRCVSWRGGRGGAGDDIHRDARVRVNAQPSTPHSRSLSPPLPLSRVRALSLSIAIPFSINTYEYIHIYVYIYSYIYTNEYVCMYVCICIYMYAGVQQDHKIAHRVPRPAPRVPGNPHPFTV